MLGKTARRRGEFIEVPFQGTISLTSLQKAVEKEGHYELGGIITIAGSAGTQVALFMKGNDGPNIGTIKLEGHICKAIFIRRSKENVKLIKAFDAQVSPFIAQARPAAPQRELFDEGTRAMIKKICETDRAPGGPLIMSLCMAISPQYTLGAIQQCGGSVTSYKKGLYEVSKGKGGAPLCVITTPKGFRRHTVTFLTPEEDLELIKNFIAKLSEKAGAR